MSEPIKLSPWVYLQGKIICIQRQREKSIKVNRALMKLIIIIVSTFNCYHSVRDAATGKSSSSIVFMAELWSIL